MSNLLEIRPTATTRVMDLVSEAGIDVSDWANYEGSEPAANPKYCYEWSFTGPNVVVLNLWFERMQSAADGTITCRINPRLTAAQSSVALHRKRADRMDTAIQVAKNRSLPVRVIICDGEMRNIDVPDAQSSKVQARGLDSVTWEITSYDTSTGEAILTRQSDSVLTGQPWTPEEVRETISDYFHMLRLELAGQRYSKTSHRRALLPKLMGRSESSVEMKHRNISAALVELGAMALPGYKPLPNYQGILFDAVAAHLESDKTFDLTALAAVELPAESPLDLPFDSFVVPRPEARPPRVREDGAPRIARVPQKRDYIERESRNRALGLAGEQLVMRYESHRLWKAGKKHLADRIEHVSVERGDGAGYDVQSFEENGKERFIEVKTTSFIAETPFFVSANELRFAEEYSDQYFLYRLFAFRSDPQMFYLPGRITGNCVLDPISFRARLT